MSITDLGQFEDVYYATCAKLKELLQGVDLLLTNGFRSPSDTYFEYRQYKRLSELEPITIRDFKASLHAYKSILCSTEITDLLNKGIVEMDVHNDRHKSQMRMSCVYSIGHNDHHCSPTALEDGMHQTEEHIERQRDFFQQNCSMQTKHRALQDTTNMGCSMIFGSLAEKYRPMVLTAESKGASIKREPTPDAPQIDEKPHFIPEYISPYNLEERAKKLNIPGGPEMPCLCDPDCICAPVCASDPTQNCLCEENGLFACVTQGMDIDDLDVPDLERCERRDSHSRQYSVASPTGRTETMTEHSVSTTRHATAYDDSLSLDDTEYEGEKQQQMHWGMQSNDEKVANGTSVSEIIYSSEIDPVPGPNGTSLSETLYTSEVDPAPGHNGTSLSKTFYSSEINPGHFWQVQDPTLLEMQALEWYRKALTQPISKQCPFPPKRYSMTERLFSSRTNAFTRNRKALTLKQVPKVQTTGGSARKTIKQTNKRSLPDMSFTGLKFVLRHGSPMQG